MNRMDFFVLLLGIVAIIGGIVIIRTNRRRNILEYIFAAVIIAAGVVFILSVFTPAAAMGLAPVLPPDNPKEIGKSILAMLGVILLALGFYLPSLVKSKSAKWIIILLGILLGVTLIALSLTTPAAAMGLSQPDQQTAPQPQFKIPSCTNKTDRAANELIQKAIKGGINGVSYMDGNLIWFNPMVNPAEISTLTSALKLWGWENVASNEAGQTWKEPDGGFEPCPPPFALQ